MAGYEVIGDVSVALRDKLAAQLENVGQNGGTDPENGLVKLSSPADVGEDGNGLSLFLYRVTENGSEKNVPSQRSGASTVQPSPLSLDLYYLVTAYTNGDTEQVKNGHVLLGRVMQLLDSESLLAGVADDTETHVTFYPQTMAELSDIWAMFPDTPLQPSVSYLVSPVRIDTDPYSVTPVVERRSSGEDAGGGDS